MGQTLTPLPGGYAICRLPRGAEVLVAGDPADLWSLTRTSAETSIVCRAHEAPDGAVAPRAFYRRQGWREDPDGTAGPPGLPVTRCLRDL